MLNNNRVAYLKHSFRQTNFLENGRSQIIYADFEDGSTVRIEKGTAFKDSTYIPERRLKIQQLVTHAATNNLYEAIGVPNVYITEAGQYLILSGRTDDTFYFCEATQIKYYEKWRGKIHCTVFGKKQMESFFQGYAALLLQ